MKSLVSGFTQKPSELYTLLSELTLAAWDCLESATSGLINQLVIWACQAALLVMAKQDHLIRTSVSNLPKCALYANHSN